MPVLDDPLAVLNATTAAASPNGLIRRGVALARLDELAEAQRCLEKALKRVTVPLDRARALAALGEVLAARRDLARAQRLLVEAGKALRVHGDRLNSAWVGIVLARLKTLEGDELGARRVLTEASRAARSAGPLAQTGVALAQAEQWLRQGRPRQAQAVLSGLPPSGTPDLDGEVRRLLSSLTQPVGTRHRGTRAVPINLLQLCDERASFVVDGFRREVRHGPHHRVSLASRPSLYRLVEALAEGAAADQLIRSAFEVQLVNNSHRSRLRVALGRLRRLLGPACIVAFGSGWRLSPEPVLLRPTERWEPIRSALSDGAEWSAENLARVTRLPRRTVQRGLSAMAEVGDVEARGAARARRYALVSTAERLATNLLLRGT